MAGEFAPEGKAHRILRRLDAGPADTPALTGLLRGPNQSGNAARQRTFNMLVALRSQHLVQSASGLHRITEAGARALIGLNHGHPYQLTQGPARVFERLTA